MIPSGTTRGEVRLVSMSSEGTLQAYGANHGRRVHRDAHLLVMALTVIVVSRVGVTFVGAIPVLDRVSALIVSTVIVVVAWLSRIGVGLVLISCAALLSTASALASHRAPFAASYTGPAIVRDDPQWRTGTVRTTLQIEGKRFAVVAGGAEGRRLLGARYGEVVQVVGRRTARDLTSYDLARHVVGRFEVMSVGTVDARSSPIDRSTNRVRHLLLRASNHAAWSTGGLYLGLVVGDDRFQDDALVGAFRDSGLSHLTAVSGQNIALMLGLLQPLLRRMGTPIRTAFAIALVAWFVVATRAEPSVIRAATSAIVVLLAALRGRQTSGLRILAVVTTTLLVIDPLLAWSVGFLLSVSATWGIVAITPRLENVLRGPGWLRTAMATTAGAQLAVIPVSLAVFERVSVVGLVTNLPAVPLASFVMVVGLPVGIGVGALSALVETTTGWELLWLWRLVMLPVSVAMLALRQIAMVASLRH